MVLAAQGFVASVAAHATNASRWADSPERNNMPILFGILIGAMITAVVVMIFLVFAAKSYKPFSKIMDRLIDWAERF